MTYGLNDVPRQEWSIAKQHFSDNPDKVKAGRYRGLNDGIQGLSHSFICINDQVYAIARKETIGKGGFARVKEVLAEDGQRYALKIEANDSRDNVYYEYRTNVHQDFSVMQKIGVFFGHIERKGAGKQNTVDKHYILQSLKPGISLTQFISFYFNHLIRFDIKEDTYHFKISLGIAIAEAIKALHDQNIIHCDIKTENVLIDYDGYHIKAHLIDMDRSVQLNLGQTYHQGARDSSDRTAKFVPCDPNFAAPEARDSQLLSKAHDIYSLALTLGCIPGGGPIPCFLASASDLSPDFLERWSKIDTFNDMIDKDPQGRPNIDSVIERLKWIRNNLFTEKDRQPFQQNIRDKTFANFDWFFSEKFGYQQDLLEKAIDSMQLDPTERAMVLDRTNTVEKRLASQHELFFLLYQLFQFTRKDGCNEAYLFRFMKKLDFSQKTKLDVYDEIVTLWQGLYEDQGRFRTLFIVKKVDPVFVVTYLKRYHASEEQPAMQQSITKKEAQELLLLAQQYREPLIESYLQLTYFPEGLPKEQMKIPHGAIHLDDEQISQDLKP